MVMHSEQVNNRVFSIHKYKMKEFHDIKPHINVDSTCLDWLELPGDPDDFRNTFRVLYSPYVL
jgi:hypothetical protein